MDSIREEQEVCVATKTTEEVLAEIRRHIDELEARANGVAQAQVRLQERLTRLREEEATARTAIREKAEVVDEKLRQLEIDVAITESRVASETAREPTAFTESVEAELVDWDAAIERLQTRAAAMTHQEREQAEAVIAEIRRARNRAANRLAALHGSAHDTWPENRDRVTEALGELERRVREASASYH
jgi:hypothetical protein